MRPERTPGVVVPTQVPSSPARSGWHGRTNESQLEVGDVSERVSAWAAVALLRAVRLADASRGQTGTAQREESLSGSGSAPTVDPLRARASILSCGNRRKPHLAGHLHDEVVAGMDRSCGAVRCRRGTEDAPRRSLSRPRLRSRFRSRSATEPATGWLKAPKWIHRPSTTMPPTDCSSPLNWQRPSIACHPTIAADLAHRRTSPRAPEHWSAAHRRAVRCRARAGRCTARSSASRPTSAACPCRRRTSPPPVPSPCIESRANVRVANPIEPWIARPARVRSTVCRMDVIAWLLDSDPTLRWQVERDLVGAPPEIWQATRARIATEGDGAALLAHQDPDGQWAGGSFFPADMSGDEEGQPWTATTWTLTTLREWGLDAAALAGTADKLDANCRWEYDDLPYWGGEVDVCINAMTLANGAWLGADMSSARPVVSRASTLRWRLELRVGRGFDDGRPSTRRSTRCAASSPMRS